MLEGGVPFAVVASIMGWSPATTVRMAKRYGHIGQTALTRAVESISGAAFESGSFAFPFDVEKNADVQPVN